MKPSTPIHRLKRRARRLSRDEGVPLHTVLLGARPGHGKTLTSLEIVMDAVERGRPAWYFTLESTLAETLERVRRIGRDPSAFTGCVTFDDSNAIRAEHVVARLSGVDPGGVAVVDYLQLLDRRRENPSLGE